MMSKSLITLWLSSAFLEDTGKVHLSWLIILHASPNIMILFIQRIFSFCSTILKTKAHNFSSSGEKRKCLVASEKSLTWQGPLSLKVSGKWILRFFLDGVEEEM